MNHPYIKNERQLSRFFVASSSDTGLVIYKTIYTESVNINPGNIGIELGGLLNIGSPLVIHRGFRAQVNAGKSGLLRYFDIYSSGHPLANNTLKLKYSHNDMSYFTPGFFTPSALKVYVSPLSDMSWSSLPSQQSTLVSSPSNLDGQM